MEAHLLLGCSHPDKVDILLLLLLLLLAETPRRDVDGSKRRAPGVVGPLLASSAHLELHLFSTPELL